MTTYKQALKALDTQQGMEDLAKYANRYGKIVEDENHTIEKSGKDFNFRVKTIVIDNYQVEVTQCNGSIWEVSAQKNVGNMYA